MCSRDPEMTSYHLADVLDLPESLDAVNAAEKLRNSYWKLPGSQKDGFLGVAGGVPQACAQSGQCPFNYSLAFHSSVTTA